MSTHKETPDRPIARPIASTNTSRSAWSGGERTSTTARNTVSTSGGDRAPHNEAGRRAGRHGLAVIRKGLSSRDIAILQSIDTHRFLTSRHLQVLHFADHGSLLAGTRATNRVLRRLAGLRLISHLERRVGGIRAGSASYVWQLASAGTRLLDADRGSARHRSREPSLRLLDHTLAVADIHVALFEAAHGGALELVRLEIEPHSWRRFLGTGGEQRLLRPDLAIVTAQGDFEDHWFVEADLGTEHPPTVVRKCQLYEAYRATGAEQDAHGVFPRVLWVVPNDSRANKLTAAICAAKLDLGLFRVCTTEQLVGIVLGGAV